LKDARFRAAENEKEQTKKDHTLAAIEQAALQAYQKDLAVEFGEAEAKKANLKMIALREKYGGEVDISGRPAAPPQEEQDTSKIKDEIQANVQRKLEELQRQKQAAAAQEAAAAQCPWQLYYSPEGYPYYYNTTTGGTILSLCVIYTLLPSLYSLTIETQWEAPPGYQPTRSSSVETPVQETEAGDTQKLTTTESDQDNTSDSSNEQNTTTIIKRSVDEAELESRESHQPSKRRAGPYGAWSTVAVYERTEEEISKESQKGGGGEEEGDSSEEDEEREDKLKFVEKTVGSLGRSEEGGEPTAVAAGAFKGFGFKKRAGNRPQIRQLRTNDL
jgi:hypothetical protein